jgi:hypothetical protein
MHLGGKTTPTVDTFVARLRADLTATFEIAVIAGEGDGGLAHPFPDETPASGRLYA